MFLSDGPETQFYGHMELTQGESDMQLPFWGFFLKPPDRRAGGVKRQPWTDLTHVLQKRELFPLT